MKSKYRAAIIGCGRMGMFTSEAVLRHSPACCLPLSHADAISMHPRLFLTAFSDTDAVMLDKATSRFPGKGLYSDPIELLSTERPALLGLATRTLGRAKLILAAVETGTHAIHTEKPLCNSMNELKALASILQRPDVFLTWGAIRRFIGVYRQAMSLAMSGRYGAMREVRVNMGSAPLYWTHPHSIDLLLFAAAGRCIEGVQARMTNVVSDGAKTCIVSDPRIVTASVYFEGGLTGHITQAIGSDFILSCEEGEIAIMADGSRLEVYAANNSPYPIAVKLEIEPSDLPTGTLGPISQLVQCLDGNAEAIQANIAVKRDIISAQTVSFAMLQSHLEGSRIVELSSIDPDMLIKAKTNGKYA